MLTPSTLRSIKAGIIMEASYQSRSFSFQIHVQLPKFLLQRPYEQRVYPLLYLAADRQRPHAAQHLPL